MNVPRRLRGISGGRCCGGAPRPSGAGSTRHDGALAAAAGARGRAPAVEERSGRSDSPASAALYISASHVVHEARVGDVGGLHAVDLHALARGQARRRRRASPGGGRRGRRSRPPRRPPVPRDDEAVLGGLDGRRPGRAGPSTTVAMRSDSFRRSSCAPRTTVSPSAKQPSSATSGSSSMASGTSSASTTVPTSGPAVTSRSRIGSARGDLVAGLVLEVADDDRPPMRWTMRTKPRARPVHADAARSTSARARHEHARGDRRTRPSDGSPGTTQLVERRARRRRPTVTWRAVAVHGHAGGGEHALGVVAARLPARRPWSRRRRPARRAARTT